MDYGKEHENFIRWGTGKIKYRQGDGLVDVGMKRPRSEEWASIDDQKLAYLYDRTRSEELSDGHLITFEPNKKGKPGTS